jgi:hypothetical protein
MRILQRDEAYRAPREPAAADPEQRQLVSLNQELEAALSKVKQLSGLVPICSYCKRIRTDENYWEQVDATSRSIPRCDLSHGICPPCYKTPFLPALRTKSVVSASADPASLREADPCRREEVRGSRALRLRSHALGR